MPLFTKLLAVLVAACLPLAPASAQFAGHGGPVRALAISLDGAVAMSGSFDGSAILWAVESGTALAVLRIHDGAVNAVAALPDGRFATGGEDGRIALWRGGAREPERVVQAHQGPVAGLAASPDGERIASASWDGMARVTVLATGASRVLKGHRGNVNAVAFTPDGRAVTGGYDGTVRVWSDGSDTPLVATLPSPINALSVAPDGEIAAAGSDGTVRLLGPDGIVRAEIETQPVPIVALARSPDGTRIAAAATGGAVAVIDRARRRVLFHLVGPGLPVWSLAYRPDGGEILTGGGDRLVRRWDARTGEPIGPRLLSRPAAASAVTAAAAKESRGAELYGACQACHALTPDDGGRAGPTLHGIIGRRIGTAPGYRYSDALRGMDIVWNTETIGALFSVGPTLYTPGTKMPEQRVPDDADRAALVRFIAEASR